MSKNMHLFSSTYDGKPTFKMIPISKDCPYNEVLFDPTEKILAIVSKEKKDNFHMLPRLSELGDMIPVKGKPRPSGKSFHEQRVTLETYYEYYMTDLGDIEQFIELFAANATTFQYSSFLYPTDPVEPASETV
jgi:hypothetical protein